MRRGCRRTSAPAASTPTHAERELRAGGAGQNRMSWLGSSSAGSFSAGGRGTGSGGAAAGSTGSGAPARRLVRRVSQKNLGGGANAFAERYWAAATNFPSPRRPRNSPPRRRLVPRQTATWMSHSPPLYQPNWNKIPCPPASIAMPASKEERSPRYGHVRARLDEVLGKHPSRPTWLSLAAFVLKGPSSSCSACGPCCIPTALPRQDVRTLLVAPATRERECEEGLHAAPPR
jgi:hypothetical protein